MNGSKPHIIEPRQRFDVLVWDGDGNPHKFLDGGFNISAGGVLSVNTSDGKQAHVWATGFWSNVSVVAQDG